MTGRVEDIREHFDPDAVGVIIVSEREDGTYVVIDGQHRIEAINAMGWTDQKVECKIHRGLRLDQEAKLVVEYNNTRKFPHLQTFLNRVTAGDPEAVVVNSIVKDAGLVVDGLPGEGHVHAVAALEAIYRGKGFRTDKEHPKELANTLRVVCEAWGKTAHALNGLLLQGIGMVMLAHGDRVDIEGLISKCSKFPGGPAALLGRAKGLRELKGGNVPTNVYAVVCETYNRGRRNGTLDATLARPGG